MKIRKINPFVIGYILGLAFLAFLGYSAGDYTARVKEKQQIDLVKSHNFTTDVAFVDLPRMNLTIASTTGTAGRIRIDMSLEVEKKNLARVEDFQPIIMDRLVSYVQQLDAKDMRKANAPPNLRKELLEEVNKVSYPMPVLDVIFKQFVVL